MKRKLTSILLALVLLITIATPALAGLWEALIYVTENDGVDQPVLGYRVPVNTPYLVAESFISATGLNSSVGTGAVLVPYMLCDDKLFAVTQLNANETDILTFSTGTTVPLTAFDIIVGDSGYITINDVAAMELGSDFGIDFTGVWVDTTDSNFIHLNYKRSSYTTSITDTDEISGIIYLDEPQELVPSGFNAWTDVDVTDYVPAHATGVVVHLTNTTPGALLLGTRMNGSADALVLDTQNAHGWTIVGIDADDIFELYLEDATCHSYLVGFTGSDFTFKAAADDISLAGALAWTDIDLTAEAPNATGAIIAILNNDAANNRDFGLRMDGSADARINELWMDGISWAVIGCDGSQVIEGYVETLDVDFYLVGYTTGNVTYNLNAADKSLGVFAAWTAIDCSAQTTVNTTHLIFEMISNNPGAGADDYGFRRNGSAENIQLEGYKHYWAIVECDENQIVEGWAQNLNVDFFLVGYIEGYIGPPIERKTSATGVASGEHTAVVTSLGDDADFDDWAADASVAVNMGAGMIPAILLEKQELIAPAASITFSNIDTLVAKWDAMSGTTSRHLVLMVNAASPDAVAKRAVEIQFNGDSGANYNHQTLTGEAGVDDADRQTGVNALFEYPGGTDYPFAVPGTTYANAFGGGQILIPHAFNTLNHKVALALGGAVEDYVSAVVGRWASVSAITNMVLVLDTGNFATGSTYWLGVVDERYNISEEILSGGDGTFTAAAIAPENGDLLAIGYLRSVRGAPSDGGKHTINDDVAGGNYFLQNIIGNGAVATAAPGNDRSMANISGDTAPAGIYGAVVGFYNQFTSVKLPQLLSISGYHTPGDSKVALYSTRRNNVAAITKLNFYASNGPDYKDGSGMWVYQVPRYVIDRQELVAPAATITFNNIPQGYEALQLNVYARSDDAGNDDEVLVHFNTDAVAANYDAQYLYGRAAVPAAIRAPNSEQWLTINGNGAGGNEFGGGILTLPSYASVDRHKHGISLSGANEDEVMLISSRWEDTSAIVRIDLSPNGGLNFLADCVFELVGIMPNDLFLIDVDAGDIDGIADGNNVTVPDNDNDWVLMDNSTVNFMPYMASYEHTVGGVLIAHYEPVSYILGTALPDRVAPAQDGTFVFGPTNPTGVTVRMLGLFPAAAFAGADEPLETPDALGGMAQPADMFGAEDEGVSAWDTLFPFLPTFEGMTNTPTGWMGFFLSALIVILIMGIMMKSTQNLWLTGLGMNVGLGIGIAMGSFPPWFLIIGVILAVGAASIERSPQL